MKYQILGIDIDGTLVHANARISQQSLDAIRAAQDAGTYVVPCTGRAWHESRHVLECVSGLTEGVFITGATVTEVATGRCVDSVRFEPELAMSLVQILSDEPEAVLVHQEPNEAGYDYLVTGRGELTKNSRWWFESTGASVRHLSEVVLNDLRHTLRVGVVASGRRMPGLVRRIKGVFQRRVEVHAFAAVQQPDPDDSVHILEIFAEGVDKWRGLAWIAAERNVEHGQIATIGDEINDLSMVRHAGCGVAMGNAIEPLKLAADHVTENSSEDGAALAIHHMLEGLW